MQSTAARSGSSTSTSFSWRWKLPALFALMAVLTVAAFGVVAYRAVRVAALESAQVRLQSALAEIVTILELGAVNQLDVLRASATHPAIVAALRGPRAPAMRDAIAALKPLQGAAGDAVVELIGADGVARLVLPEHAPASPKQTFDFPPDATINPMVERDGALYLQSSVSVRDQGAAIGGIRVTRRTVQGTANRRIAERLLGEEVALLIGNRHGTLWLNGRAVSHPPPAGSPAEYVRDGAAWLSLARPVPQTPWLAALELPEAAALAPARALIAPFVLIGALIAVGAALLGVPLSRTITRPLADVTAAAEAMARGDRDVHLASVDRRDEIGRLARAFATMATSVRGVHEKLESEIDARTGELTGAVARLERLHEELRQSERFATLGRLSGSVGTELRNPLGVMSKVVFLLESLPDASPKLKDYASLLRTQIRLSERLISDLLDRARLGEPAYSTVDIARLVDDVLDRANIPGAVRVERRISTPLPSMRLDRDQVSQILQSLVTNAVHAMHGGPGTLTIAASAAGARLRIEVRDTGPGIDRADVERVFDPSFTTKPQGVGLGLSISRAFARAGGGDLFVAGAGGRGACFVLDLPAVPALAQASVESGPEVGQARA
jgi:signal transduction histidine kinase